MRIKDIVTRERLSDGYIQIRPLEKADVDDVLAAVQESTAELGRWMSWAHPGFSREESATYVSSRVTAWTLGATYGFAITDLTGARFLGTSSISHIHPTYRFANLGYWIRSSQTGKGYATAAARLTARFAFDILKLIRLEIVVAVGNQASLRVAEKAGAKREAILRNRLIIHTEIYDAVMHSLVPEDFSDSHSG